VTGKTESTKNGYIKWPVFITVIVALSSGLFIVPSLSVSYGEFEQFEKRFEDQISTIEKQIKQVKENTKDVKQDIKEMRKEAKEDRKEAKEDNKELQKTLQKILIETKK